MKESEIKSDLDQLIKRAQEQPGIADLMLVYGQYEELLRKSHEYLAEMRPKSVVLTAASSS